MHKKLVVILGILIIAIAGADIGFFRLYKIKKLNEKISKVWGEVDQLSKKVVQIPQLRAEVKKLEDAEAVFKSKLPTEQEASVDSFIRILASYARLTKCETTRLVKITPTITPETESMPFSTVTFEINIQGNFYDAMKFVSMLENQERLVNIESFAVRKNPSEQENPEATTIPLTFSTYVWKNR